MTPGVALVAESPVADSYVLAAFGDPEDNDDLFLDDVVRRERLVLRIQEVLADLGIYVGPVDGKDGPLTERAVRYYQSQVGLRVTGRATEELLNHLETVGRANKLLRRIDNVREREIDRARHALAQQRITRNLLQGEAEETADPTRDANACLASPTVICMLAEALESAKAIADQKFRDWAYGDIVVAQVKAGRARAALKTAGLIDDPRLIIAALGNISQTQAERGDLDDSRAMSEIIPDLWNRFTAVASIARAEAALGFHEQALATAGEVIAMSVKVDRPPRIVAALGRLSIDLYKAGSFHAAALVLDKALDMTRRADMNQAEREASLSEVAVATAEAGQLDEALGLITGIDNQSLRRPVLTAAAGVLARNGDSARALMAAKEITDARYRSVAYSDIAVAIEGGGDRARALTTVRLALDATEAIDAKYSFAKGYAISRASLALIAMKALPEALAVARNIEDAALRTKALWVVAAAQARAGDETGAEATFALALAAAEEVVSDLDRAWTLASIAATSARMEDTPQARRAFLAARDIAAGIESAWARANVLTKLATTLIELR